MLAQPVAYFPPRTETERRLEGIWREVLNMDRVGIEDDFNDLGGDSFLAAVIFGEIEEIFTITIPMATLLVAPSIARLARKVDELVSARELQP
ncbi:MAG TPA: phosphopantetheine-binding protein [Stellaceae bacterium]|nr:phosphopantetheine-binding protein [Stellaceae bacterium]